ncbi:hypothetical protein FH969_14455 [Miniimonas arenae]|uniref:DUF4232 domain-containing protein n=1 Tax=Miniimonas arenae TaxID=676201 RepID=A0A5C5BA45_9MICO|nr:hypothetical protein [Miniimonas arenae]TNU72865.1 hypothetical protein FH969_14455 [Miniimonas arenae]
MPNPSRPTRATAAAYRRRRLVALILGLLVLGAAAWGVTALVGLFTGGDAEATGTPTSSPAGDPTDVPTDAGTGGATDPTTAPEPSPTEYPLGATPPTPTACTPEQAQLTLTVPATNAVGAGVAMVLGVSTGSGPDCLVDLGSGATVLEISSGGVPVWSSAQCPFEPTSRRLLLPADSEDFQDLSWPGALSQDGCPGGMPVAQAGTYLAVVTQTSGDQVLRAEATFVLQ